MQAFVLVLALMAHPNHDTTGCGALQWDGVEEVYLSRAQVVLNIVRMLREVGEIEMPIVVCDSLAGYTEDSVPLPAAQTHTDADGVFRGYIHMPSKVLNTFGAAALRGVIAHEVAHLVVYTSNDCRMMRIRLDPVTNEERVACETPADIKATEWTDRRSS